MVLETMLLLQLTEILIPMEMNRQEVLFSQLVAVAETEVLIFQEQLVLGE